MTNRPCISVIMSCYNAANYLELSINSILQQSYKNFEFIIINDASTDGTARILKQWDDPRIRVIENVGNLGLTASLNIGLNLAQGQFIVRMDADDISHPHRLALQEEFLSNHPDVSIVGSFAEIIDSSGNTIKKWSGPVTASEIYWTLHFGPPFIHPTVMIRKSVLIHNDLQYDTSFLYAQDYHLWCRLLETSNGYNLPYPLLKYRIHDQQVTTTVRGQQLALHENISKHALERSGLWPQLKESDLNQLSTNRATKNPDIHEMLNEIRVKKHLLKRFKKSLTPLEGRALECYFHYDAIRTMKEFLPSLKAFWHCTLWSIRYPQCFRLLRSRKKAFKTISWHTSPCYLNSSCEDLTARSNSL